MTPSLRAVSIALRRPESEMLFFFLACRLHRRHLRRHRRRRLLLQPSAYPSTFACSSASAHGLCPLN